MSSSAQNRPPMSAVKTGQPARGGLACRFSSFTPGALRWRHRLCVAEIQSILTLYERGWSCRRNCPGTGYPPGDGGHLRAAGTGTCSRRRGQIGHPRSTPTGSAAQAGEANRPSRPPGLRSGPSTMRRQRLMGGITRAVEVVLISGNPFRGLAAGDTPDQQSRQRVDHDRDQEQRQADLDQRG